MDLDEIERGVVVVGLRAGPVEIIDATQQGPDAKLLVFREASGAITEQLLFRSIPPGSRSPSPARGGASTPIRASSSSRPRRCGFALPGCMIRC